MPEPVLSIKNIEAGYTPSLPILRGVSLDVFEGEIVTILGPNGAGKSTLIKAIAGLVKISSGTVSLEGRDITGLATHELIRERVAYVPQSENVFARLSVEENLALGTLHNPTQHASQRRRVLDLFPDLEHLGHLAAGKLSGGQRQMVAVGRALMAAPKLLMVDEPSAGLSPKLAQVVFAQLVQVKQTGVTILMVEQNARAALQISDRGYVMAEGQEKVHGAAASLLENPEVGALYLGAKSRMARS
ncbi:MAG: ABC transporter ATP-binding protein [Proteobacteria bacterium]|nr:ABC transporter ATP-binding protein [Pseudomonadota bacterium]MDA1057392.1 ABC transporter ATP-binding protein [Pseudomonadota bacterium]